MTNLAQLLYRMNGPKAIQMKGMALALTTLNAETMFLQMRGFISSADHAISLGLLLGLSLQGVKKNDEMRMWRRYYLGWRPHLRGLLR